MSLVNTLMQPLRAQYQGTLDKMESRPSHYGVYDFFVKDSKGPSPIFTDDIRAKIKSSFGNIVQVPVVDAHAITISNVRSCTVADDENTSQLVTLTFVTYSFSLSMYTAQYFNQDVKYQADFTRKLNDRCIKLAATIDTAAVAVLEAAKNQFWTGTAGYYAQSGNALQVPNADRNDFYNQAASILQTMDFQANPNILTNPQGLPLVRYIDAQGANNGTNLSFQLSPYTWFNSNRITNNSGIRSTAYLIPDGTVALETRVDPDAIAGNSIGDVASWETVMMPLPGTPNPIQMGAFYRKDCADGSALTSGTTGLKRTLRESFEFSVDVCYATAYNSSPSTRFNPIVKAELSLT